MSLSEALEQLKALGNEKVRAQNAKKGAGDNQFGVEHGDIRALAKKIGPSRELALSLWETGNLDAQLLAALQTTPVMLTDDDEDFTDDSSGASIKIDYAEIMASTEPDQPGGRIVFESYDYEAQEEADAALEERFTRIIEARAITSHSECHTDPQ